MSQCDVIVEAERTGLYKNMHSCVVLRGQEYVEDQITGIGTIEGRWSTKNIEVIGYYAYFEMWTGYKASMYMTQQEVEEHIKKYMQQEKKNAERAGCEIVMRKLIREKGLIEEIKRKDTTDGE